MKIHYLCNIFISSIPDVRTMHYFFTWKHTKPYGISHVKVGRHEQSTTFVIRRTIWIFQAGTRHGYWIILWVYYCICKYVLPNTVANKSLPIIFIFSVMIFGLCKNAVEIENQITVQPEFYVLYDLNQIHPVYQNLRGLNTWANALFVVYVFIWPYLHKLRSYLSRKHTFETTL